MEIVLPLDALQRSSVARRFMRNEIVVLNSEKRSEMLSSLPLLRTTIFQCPWVVLLRSR